MYQDLIRTGELKSSVAMIARTPYRIAGAPIKAGDRIVGRVVLAPRNSTTTFLEVRVFGASRFTTESPLAVGRVQVLAEQPGPRTSGPRALLRVAEAVESSGRRPAKLPVLRRG